MATPHRLSYQGRLLASLADPLSFFLTRTPPQKPLIQKVLREFARLQDGQDRLETRIALKNMPRADKANNVVDLCRAVAIFFKMPQIDMPNNALFKTLEMQGLYSKDGINRYTYEPNDGKMEVYLLLEGRRPIHFEIVKEVVRNIDPNSGQIKSETPVLAINIL